MNEVEAVKTKDQITEVEVMLRKHGSQDYADIWKLGINIGLRISDLLAIKFKDIDMERREIELTEGKTKKKRTIRFNQTAISIVERRRANNPDDVYVFQAKGNRNAGKIKPMSRGTVANKFTEIGTIVGIRLGTHSMRKTLGYAMHKAGRSLEQIARTLNHSSPAITMRYIGLTKEETLNTYDEFEL